MFKRRKNKSLADDTNVEMESSICTGETIIGFKNSDTGKLERAVVVRSQGDIEAFYADNGLRNTKNFIYRY